MENPLSYTKAKEVDQNFFDFVAKASDRLNSPNFLIFLCLSETRVKIKKKKHWNFHAELCIAAMLLYSLYSKGFQGSRGPIDDPRKRPTVICFCDSLGPKL